MIRVKHLGNPTHLPPRIFFPPDRLPQRQRRLDGGFELTNSNESPQWPGSSHPQSPSSALALPIFSSDQEQTMIRLPDLIDPSCFSPIQQLLFLSRLSRPPPVPTSSTLVTPLSRFDTPGQSWVLPIPIWEPSHSRRDGLLPSVCATPSFSSLHLFLRHPSLFPPIHTRLSHQPTQAHFHVTSASTMAKSFPAFSALEDAPFAESLALHVLSLLYGISLVLPVTQNQKNVNRVIFAYLSSIAHV